MRLRHARVALELHERRKGSGTPLLLLHELGGSSAGWGAEFDAWPGAVHALDFSGHGRSGRVRGGAYSAELLAGDADAALEQIGPAAVVGAGLGAYVALLLAAARPDSVPAALLLPGAGLTGGGALPAGERGVEPAPLPDAPGQPDPRLVILERDVRPVDYAEQMSVRAQRLIFLENGAAHPPWWEAARRGVGRSSRAADLEAALAALASGR